MAQFPILKEKLCLIYAEDWCVDDGPTDRNHAFKTYSAWVVGFIIRETETSLTLASEIFDDRVRKVQTIPKSAIRRRIDFPIPGAK
jgi:hypothetical protein